jgi:hypothetical protein
MFSRSFAKAAQSRSVLAFAFLSALTFNRRHKWLSCVAGLLVLFQVRANLPAVRQVVDHILLFRLRLTLSGK